MSMLTEAASLPRIVGKLGHAFGWQTFSDQYSAFNYYNRCFAIGLGATWNDRILFGSPPRQACIWMSLKQRQFHEQSNTWTCMCHQTTHAFLPSWHAIRNPRHGRRCLPFPWTNLSRYGIAHATECQVSSTRPVQLPAGCLAVRTSLQAASLLQTLLSQLGVHPPLKLMICVWNTTLPGFQTVLLIPWKCPPRI